MTDTCTVPFAPGRVPGLGHVPALLRRLRDPLGLLVSLADWGDIFQIDVPFMPPVVFVTQPELAHEVLVTQAASFEKGRMFDRMRPLVGDGLGTAARINHRRRRRLMQPVFHQQRLAEYGEVMSRLSVEWAESWRPGQLLDLHQAAFEWTLDILATTLFAADIGRRAGEVVRRDVPTVMRTLMTRAFVPPTLDGLPIPANRDFNAASTRLRQVIDEMIAAERARSAAGPNSLIGLLLATRDADTGEQLSDEEIKDELATILFAGTDTSALTLIWTFWEISQAPEVEQRLIDEITTVIGDRAPTFADIGRLLYTRQVIEETLRLHSPTVLERRTVDEVKLGGYKIPPGTEVALSPYGLHRRQGVFPNAETFDPDRWLPERRNTDAPREAVFSFGGGARKCIGDGFALAGMTIGLAAVLARWRLVPEAGFRPHAALALIPHPTSMPMRVEPHRS